MELIDSLCDLETTLTANQHGIMALSSDSFTTATGPLHHHEDQQQPQLPAAMSFIPDHGHDMFSHSHVPNDQVLIAQPTGVDFGQQISEMGKPSGGRKRKRNNKDKDMEKLKEVIHVRAKRGQATDSHSLAERVRREKINERLRCLQNLVPGCYKTMGMAVMLDVVISYVQSLQNQIEFLSMKLSAASVYYDFNSPGHADPVDTIQGTNAYEVQENMVRSDQGGYGGLSFSQATSWPL